MLVCVPAAVFWKGTRIFTRKTEVISSEVLEISIKSFFSTFSAFFSFEEKRKEREERLEWQCGSVAV